MGFASKVFWSILGQRTLVRSIQAGDLMEDFLASAIVAVLAIRFYLHLTYRYLLVQAPFAGRIVTDQLHLAHLLWGGLLMLAGFIVAFTFLGRPALGLAAILGGLGFGTFIDEVGKFITRNNDYFFQPAVAIIYITFVILFIILRALQHPWARSERTALANALTYAQQAVIKDFRVEDRREALALLQECDPSEPLVAQLELALSQAETHTRVGPGAATRAWNSIRRRYARLTRGKWFAGTIVLLFIAQTISSLYQTLATVAWTATLAAMLGFGLLAVALFGPRFLRFSSRAIIWELLMLAVVMAGGILIHLQEGPQSIAAWIQILSATVSGVLVAFGVVVLRHSWLAAYRMFHHALLVNILVTQVFAFYQNQILAITGLLIQVAFLLALRFTINQEEMKLVGHPEPVGLRSEPV